MLALCETLIAGGECLDTARCCAATERISCLRGHAILDPTTLGRFLRRFTLGHVGQLNRASTSCPCVSTRFSTVSR